MLLVLTIAGIIFSSMPIVSNIKQDKIMNQTTQTMIHLARTLYSNKQYYEAINTLNKIIKRNPKHKEAYYLMGLNYTKLKKYDRALTALTKSLVLDANDSTIYNEIGVVYYEQAKYKKAKIWFLKSLEKDYLYYKALYNLGNIYYVKKDYKVALEWYKKAYSQEKNKKDILVYMANCYSFLEQPILSIKTYKEVLKLEPRNYMMYYYMAYDSMRAQDYKSAEKYYIAYISSDNKSKANYSSYINLFEVELIQNRPFHEQIEKDFLEKPDTHLRSMMIYEILKIFQQLHNGNKVDLNVWLSKYKSIGMGQWNFSSTDKWIEKEKNLEIRDSLMKAAEIFKNHRK